MKLSNKKFRTPFLLAILLVVSCDQSRIKSDEKNHQKIKEKVFQDDSLIHEGDIIFQTSGSGQSRAVQLATHSKYSHCGIIFLKNGEFCVLEAVQPVKYTTLETWVSHGDDKHFVIKRFKGSDTLLSTNMIQKMKKYGHQQLGKYYDLTFEWSDQRMYCSELVWKIYETASGLHIGEPETLASFDLSHPIVRKKLTERYGENIPLNEKVISPAALYDSKLLKTVHTDKSYSIESVSN